ncbi:MAG: threonine aldolase family protein [Lachnospiraceae bacterium]
MILFNSDYTEGAHPAILERLTATNLVQTPGYGEDAFCEEARGYIRQAIKAPEAAVHFMVGGTQANMTVISAVLRPHQGVLSADSGHIHVHETGAVEACGHKVLALPGADGKITAAQILAAHQEHCNDGAFEHMVQPKMVYISHPTELGTLYTADELKSIRKVCDQCGLYLFLDGARLGYGLCAPGTDVTLELIAQVCDLFYIGGTKVGALFGEAVVIVNPTLQSDFRYLIKQRGGMLAKGRLLGIQFAELFRDGLYYKIAQHAIDLAMQIKQGALAKGYPLFIDSTTNQQFLVVDDEKRVQLEKNYGFTYWQRYDEQRSVIRICTSWATKAEDVTQLLADL